MKIGKSSYLYNNVYLKDSSTIVGEMEATGPLGHYFETSNTDPYFGMNSWEQAEMKMTQTVIQQLLEKTKLQQSDIDIAFGGDLVNQLVPSNYAMRNFEIPFMGVYSACATAIEAMILASTYIESKLANRALVFASSHTNMAEKQFRMPVEYGGHKNESAQYTATGSGAGLLTSNKTEIKIHRATIGRVIDANQKNPADMGSAMAPAAAETIKQHLEDFKLKPTDYDLILTGDLSGVGTPILLEILSMYQIDISEVHNDCGKMLYHDHQPTFAGASGAGCVSIVTMSYIVEKLRKKELNNVLIIGTGALLNAMIVSQKETIPCIAHAIALTTDIKGGKS